MQRGSGIDHGGERELGRRPLLAARGLPGRVLHRRFLSGKHLDFRRGRWNRHHQISTESGTTPDSIVVADSEKVMEGGRPGPALLAHIVVSKFQDSLPLYRQCQIYERAGVSIASSTIGDWTAFALEVLEPIATRIISRVLSSFVIGADDTGLRVLDRNDPRGVKKGHIWGYVGDCKLVAFDYTKDWKSDGPAEFLRRFRGFMQGDGYAGFDRALKPDDDDEAAVVPENRRLGCGMHVRRKFEAAAQAGDARGVIAVAYFKKLYEIERSCKDEGLTADARKARRAELSMPILDELFAWVSTLHPKLVPGNATARGDALRDEIGVLLPPLLR
ncbi:MAG: IS66 family transposase [Polyangiaceae bacterium]